MQPLTGRGSCTPGLTLGVTKSGKGVTKSEKALWVESLPRRATSKQDLACLVETDHDEAETEYYECAADPSAVQNERGQARYRSMYRRRRRHLEARRDDG